MKLHEVKKRTAEPGKREPKNRRMSNIECRRVESLRSIYFIKSIEFLPSTFIIRHFFSHLLNLSPSVLCLLSSVFRLPKLRIPHSAFRIPMPPPSKIPHSKFPIPMPLPSKIPHSAFRIPHSNAPQNAPTGISITSRPSLNALSIVARVCGRVTSAK
jgi:hypothetical protein